MRWKEITEAPLGSLETYGDFKPRANTDVSKDIDKAVRTIDNPSKKLLTSDTLRYYKAFENTPFTFNIYVYSSPTYRILHIDDIDYQKILSSIEKKVKMT